MDIDNLKQAEVSVCVLERERHEVTRSTMAIGKDQSKGQDPSSPLWRSASLSKCFGGVGTAFLRPQLETCLCAHAALPSMFSVSMSRTSM